MVFNYVSIIGEIVRVGETRWKSLCLQNEMRSFKASTRRETRSYAREGKKPMIPVIHETFYAGWPE